MVLVYRYVVDADKISSERALVENEHAPLPRNRIRWGGCGYFLRSGSKLLLQ